MFGRSWLVGRFWDIPLKVHWSFGLLLLFIVLFAQKIGLQFHELAWFCLYIMILFAFVVMHEYGHALMAGRYGIRTHDIIISPIGGLARLTGMSSEPRKELNIAIAGPLVNLFIGMLTFLLYVSVYPLNTLTIPESMSGIHPIRELLQFIIVMNGALFCFNLIPAFPMDGGRILRALLSMRFSRIRATTIAATLGKGISIVFTLLGLYYGNFTLAIVGTFVFYLAHREFKQVRVENILANEPIHTVMKRSYTRLSLQDPLQEVLDILDQGEESSLFIFNDQGEVVGSVNPQFLEEAQKEFAADTPLGQTYVSAKTKMVDIETSILNVFELMRKEGHSIVGIKENDQLAGVVDRLVISDYISSI